MTSLPPDDPLISLWQTAPKPDTQQLLHELQHIRQLHRRSNRAVLAVLCVVSLLIIFEEATGRVATHGALSALWILVVAGDVLWRRRARCQRSDALAGDTISVLRFMIRRAKSDLRIARALYVGVPCGAVVGGLIMKLVDAGGSPQATGAPSYLTRIQTGAGIAVLIGMVVTGVILARSRRLQIQRLSDQLKRIQADP